MWLSRSPLRGGIEPQASDRAGGQRTPMESRSPEKRRNQLRAVARRPLRLLGDVASVDDEFGAGDERGFVGGEKQHPVGDLDRLADPWAFSPWALSRGVAAS